MGFYDDENTAHQGRGATVTKGFLNYDK